MLVGWGNLRPYSTKGPQVTFETIPAKLIDSTWGIETCYPHSELAATPNRLLIIRLGVRERDAIVNICTATTNYGKQ